MYCMVLNQGISYSIKSMILWSWNLNQPVKGKKTPQSLKYQSSESPEDVHRAEMLTYCKDEMLIHCTLPPSASLLVAMLNKEATHWPVFGELHHSQPNPLQNGTAALVRFHKIQVVGAARLVMQDSKNKPPVFEFEPSLFTATLLHWHVTGDLLLLLMFNSPQYPKHRLCDTLSSRRQRFVVLFALSKAYHFGNFRHALRGWTTRICDADDRLTTHLIPSIRL